MWSLLPRSSITTNSTKSVIMKYQLLLENTRLTKGVGNIRTKITKAEPSYELNESGRAAALQPGKGKIYDKKPFKFTCIKGKSYMWCACGWSKSQPFCDKTHLNQLYKITMQPVLFIAPETKEYLFCNCKQTSKRPFCDGTHKKEEIQAAIKS